jgi:hypothetical protein
MKEEKALWKIASACLPTSFFPVFSVFPVVGLHSDFNSRLGLTYEQVIFHMSYEIWNMEYGI